MSIAKAIVKKILPRQLWEVLELYYQEQAQFRSKAERAERNQLKINSLLKGPEPILLELGAGKNRGIPGWTYADLNEDCDLCLDLAQPLPFPDGCVRKIYSSHLLEHFKHDVLNNFLNECKRVLEPGGTFSAAVPNARIYLDAYQNPEDFDPELFCRYTPAYYNNSKIDYVNYIAYMNGEHHYMFDEENIISLLKKARFKDARLRNFDEMLDLEIRNKQSIYVIAIK